ncbi:MAG TPA: FKBP-type peptidyl-prolyl cis-trans isomerase [Candidatus Polarisedimenticolia bacterium]|jgi:FKBP-type peptidyl-prolyl cis-trans isomerase|nr:FKBP-type peptidyl-prolyl cis-trans isomerase [Candidatus Polarisedimenticolia bacterium]
MKTWLLPVLLLATVAARAAEPAVPAPATATAPREAYLSLGSSFARDSRLAELGWNDAQFEAFIEGLRAAFRGRPYASSNATEQLQAAIGQRVQELAQREMRNYFAHPKRLQEYMKSRAKELQLEMADSGMAYGLMPGRGTTRPAPEDTVVLSFQAVAADGQTELPALAVNRKRVRVSELIPGLAEGVQLMTAGGTGLFILPPELSFNDGTWPQGVEAGTPIIFTVALHEVIVAQ